jgi:hypothetical protein
MSWGVILTRDLFTGTDVREIGKLGSSENDLKWFRDHPGNLRYFLRLFGK